MFDATHMHHGSDGLSTVSCMSAIALPDLWRVSCDDRATAVRHARVAFVLFLFLPEDFFRHACGNVQPGDVVTVDLASEQQASARGSASSSPRGALVTAQDRDYTQAEPRGIVCGLLSECLTR